MAQSKEWVVFPESIEYKPISCGRKKVKVNTSLLLSKSKWLGNGPTKSDNIIKQIIATTTIFQKVNLHCTECTSNFTR